MTTDPLNTDVLVSNQAWLELLHAEVCWALDRAGLDVLIIKGPSIGEWLYPNGGREPSDVDLLLRPSHWDRALHTLIDLGFSSTYEGFRDGETAQHSTDMKRTDPTQGQHGLDLHRFFPGIEAPPGEAFNELWDARERGLQADVPVWYPALTARALVIGLHAARDAHSPKTAEDLRRAMAALDDPDALAELGELAGRLNARAALRVGLETQVQTARMVAALGLSDVEVSSYWALRGAGADPLTTELARVSSLPMRDRFASLVRWVFPSAASMRTRDPRAAESSLALAGVYVKRWGSGLRRLPHAIGHIRRVRRRG